MWSSKDLTLTICLAALGAVSSALIVQVPTLITGIPVINSIFTIILAIQTSFAFLIFEGRRWRFFVVFTLLTVLTIPTYFGGPPFEVFGRTHHIISAFLADLMVNSIYGTFNNNKKLKWWSVLGTLLFWIMLHLIGLLTSYLFFSPEAFMAVFYGVSVLLPLVIVESIAGGYLGYRIYQRVRKNEVK